MRVLVVDDEPLARRRLVRMLRCLATVTAADEAADGPEALARGPGYDAVLLDIGMPGLDGLAVARALQGRATVIFTTAHPEHALEAFEASAVDYLLKPVEAARLERALARVVRRAPEPPPLRISARGRGGAVHLFDPETIDCFRAEDKVTVFVVDGREHVVEQSLSSLEATLPGCVRAHRGELVRVAAVARLEREAEGPVLVLRGGQRVAVSRRQLAEVAQRLGLRP